MAYRNIPDTEIDQDSPVTVQLMSALRDNPLSIAQGEDDAPYAQTAWHPYNSTLVGDANTGRFYNHADDGTVATVETPDFEDGYDYMVYGEGISFSGTVANVRLDAYRETGAAYQNDVGDVGVSAAAADIYDVWFILERPRRTSRVHPITGHAIEYRSDGVASKTNGDTRALGSTTADKILRARFGPISGNIDAGELFLYRKRNYQSE